VTAQANGHFDSNRPRHTHEQGKGKELIYRYCITVSTGKIIEGARKLAELWLLLETHFDRQTTLMDGLLSQLLKTDCVVNDAQVLSCYDRVLQAIQRAEEMGRMQDLLTPNQVEVLQKILHRKEANYWRIDQLNMTMEELPLAFYNFSRRRIRELRSITSPARTSLMAPSCRLLPVVDRVWAGPCMMGNVCGKNHAPESCNIFDELPLKGRLAIIQRKKYCQFCFCHPDNQPCTSQSQPACPVCGCMRKTFKTFVPIMSKNSASVHVNV
jgi:hypothetical protein